MTEELALAVTTSGESVVERMSLVGSAERESQRRKVKYEAQTALFKDPVRTAQ